MGGNVLCRGRVWREGGGGGGWVQVCVSRDQGYDASDVGPIKSTGPKTFRLPKKIGDGQDLGDGRCRVKGREMREVGGGSGVTGLVRDRE